MGWWTEKAFSKKEPDRKTDRGGKCVLCKKYRCQCSREELRSVKVNKKVTYTKPNKDGVPTTHTRTQKVNAPWKEDKRGFHWCNSCNMRVINGRCSNITCSTRR